jgi:hypothetical protein
MLKSSRVKPIALVALAVLAVLPSAVMGQRQGGAGPQGRGGQPNVPIRPILATAAIVGQVVTAGSGVPIRGAEVRLRATDGRENRLVTTDAAGRFAIRDLTPGEWGITASKAGFISQQFGQRRPFEAARPIQLKEFARLSTTFELIRAGAISGHVYDEYGDPVAGAKVQVLRSKMLRGRRQFVATGVPDQTDDTGAFRIYALGPGEYYVGASLRLAPAENVIIDSVATLPTYFPGTGSMAEAQRLPLGAGEEQSNVNITVQPVRSVRVSGTLLTSSGMPADGENVNLMSTTDFNAGGFPIGSSGVVRARGAFTIVNVPPGNYALQAFIVGDNGMMTAEQAYVPITVGSEDIAGLTIATSKGATFTGTVMADNGPLPAGVSLGVTARSERGSTEMRSGIVPRLESRLVRLQGMFGSIRLLVDGLPDGWMLKSIDVNGSDVTDTAFEVRGGENLTGRIVLTDRVTGVSGRVTSRGAVTGARVVVFPEDSAKWSYLSRYVRADQADEQGAFAISKLPPDQQYLAVAVDYLDDEEFWDPDFLERMKPRATRFSINEGEKKTLSVPLVQR